jgi:hypothetical protein
VGDLLRDLTFDVLHCMWTDPSRDEGVQVDLNKLIEILTAQRSQSQARSQNRKHWYPSHRIRQYSSRERSSWNRALSASAGPLVKSGIPCRRLQLEPPPRVGPRPGATHTRRRALTKSASPRPAPGNR